MNSKTYLRHRRFWDAPTPNGVFRVSVDASETGLGVVLEQSQDGCDRVIAYASRTLTSSERNYCTTKRELLSVIFALKKFRHYLLGRHFILRTDHASLKWLRTAPKPISQAARWLTLIEEYDFEIQHRPGSNHQNADSLSRRPCRNGCCEINKRKTNEPEGPKQAYGCASRVGHVSDPEYRPGGKSGPPPSEVETVSEKSV